MPLIGDPSSYHYGVTLKQTATHAPDGGAVADYYKGWRFLPKVATPEEKEILKKNSRVAYALEQLSNLQGSPTWGIDRRSGSSFERDKRWAKHQKVIDDAHYNLVIAPQIKAEKEQKEREEEEQRQTIATLKMRVEELTKRPIAEPTTPAVTSSLPIIPIIIIAVIVGIFLLRRRA